MLRVTVELVPFGQETGARKIVEMLIANDGDGDGTHCSYEGWISSDSWTKDQARYGKVKDHDRRQSVWTLIAKMGEACMPKFMPDTYSDSLAERLRRRLAEVRVAEAEELMIVEMAKRIKPLAKRKARKKK